MSAFVARVESLASDFSDEIRELEEDHPDPTAADMIRDFLTDLFDERVGEPFTSARLSEIYKEGKKRYESEIPPGYGDVRKGDDTRFGDLVLWYQVLERARATKRPIILVTDDGKEDWWWKSKGSTVGPRPELIREIRDYAAVSFYMYPTDRFLEQAISYLKRQSSVEAIQEIREVRQQAEQTQSVAPFHVADAMNPYAVHGPGDQVTVEVAAIDAHGNPIGGSEGAHNTYQFVLGAGTVIPDLETAVSALTVGAEGSFSIRYPDDYADPRWRGHRQYLRIKLLRVRRSDGSVLTPSPLG